jgi:hypothetical protein
MLLMIYPQPLNVQIFVSYAGINLVDLFDARWTPAEDELLLAYVKSFPATIPVEVDNIAKMIPDMLPWLLVSKTNMGFDSILPMVTSMYV